MPVGADVLPKPQDEPDRLVEKPADEEDKQTIICFTDGSGFKDKQGCGLHIKYENTIIWEDHEHLGSMSTVFQAEIVAILRAGQKLMDKLNQNIVI